MEVLKFEYGSQNVIFEWKLEYNLDIIIGKKIIVK